jgi:signal transduction histidine kinase
MPSGWLERLRPALTFRIALWYAAVFIVSALALFALSYHLLRRSLETGDHDLIRATLAEYSSQYEAGGLESLRLVLDARQGAGGSSDLYVRIVGPAREVVFLSLPRGWAELRADAFSRGNGAGILEWSAVPGRSPGDALEIASLRLADGTLFQVGRGTERRTEVLARFRGVLAWVLALVLVAGLAGGTLFTHSALRPVRELTRVVSGIVATGSLSQRVRAGGRSDPIDTLAGHVNTMLARIERLVTGMRESLDNVAHDLRTPLTRLQVILEDALQKAEPGRSRDSIADALEETERVTGTLNALLDLSEAEAGAMRLELQDDAQPVALAAVIADAVELYADLADEKGVAITVSLVDGLAVPGDRRRLRQVFANLVDNAVKYTPPGGRITIDGRAEDDVTVVEVADTGPGVPAADRERIWERLYRGDRSRSERGLGIGLSLVRAIVAAHGGTAEVASVAPEGARFRIRLPR